MGIDEVDPCPKSEQQASNPAPIWQAASRIRSA